MKIEIFALGFLLGCSLALIGLLLLRRPQVTKKKDLPTPQDLYIYELWNHPELRPPLWLRDGDMYINRKKACVWRHLDTEMTAWAMDVHRNIAPEFSSRPIRSKSRDV